MNSLISTSYFPSVSYLRDLKQFNSLTMDHGEHFIKQTHRNRCEILGANGRLKLIVPLRKWKNNTPVKDIRISYDESWQKLHWKSLESAYRSSPYFEYYEDRFRALIIERQHNYLVDLNKEILDFIVQSLNISLKIDYSLEYQKMESGSDLRNKNYLLADYSEDFNSYIQVFSKDSSFEANLSCIDLICNEGPNGINLLC
ncbi:MAG: WbqC family protein [Vicingaceae bacterium]